MKVNKLLTCLSLVAVALCVPGCESSSSGTYETPYDLIEDACEKGNYSISMRASEAYSVEVSVADFEVGNVDLNYLRSTLEVEYEYQVYAYYTEDALLVEYYQLRNGVEYLEVAYLYLNEGIWGGLLDTVKVYFTYDNRTWYYYGRESDVTWNKMYWSLFDNPTSVGLIPYSFYYVDNGKDDEGKYQLYTCVSDNVEALFSYLVGVDLYDYYLLGYYDLYSTDYIKLYSDYMYTYFASDIWYFTDTSYEYAMLGVESFDTKFYDVGSTDISERVQSIEDNAVWDY